MSQQPQPAMVGRCVTLSDEGEGWFTNYADISGTIEYVVESNQGNNPYYVVRFETPLEVQESGAPTPSGFILRRYPHCIVHCRWQGTDINADAPVSVHVALVPSETEPPKSRGDMAGMTIRAWAGCLVSEG
jgi:hypothetical protein